MSDDSFRKQLLIDGVVCGLGWFVPVAPELAENTGFRQAWIRECDAVMFVFDLTSRPTLDKLDSMRDEVRRLKGGATVPVVIVGNKRDLKQQREVTAPQGKAYADECDAAFRETSARETDSVEQVFFDLMRLVRASNGENVTTKSGCVIA